MIIRSPGLIKKEQELSQIAIENLVRRMKPRLEKIRNNQKVEAFNKANIN